MGSRGGKDCWAQGGRKREHEAPGAADLEGTACGAVLGGAWCRLGHAKSGNGRGLPAASDRGTSPRQQLLTGAAAPAAREWLEPDLQSTCLAIRRPPAALVGRTKTITCRIIN